MLGMPQNLVDILYYSVCFSDVQLLDLKKPNVIKIIVFKDDPI